MKMKSLLLVILLSSIIILSSSNVFAENSSEIQSNDDSSLKIIESQEITDLSENNNDEKLSNSYDITQNSDSEKIQDTINNMNDGDILNFENGTYTDICIYVNKSITINGNGATLIGHETPSKNNTPDIIYNPTNESGYAISNFATLYLLGTSKNTTNNIFINGLTIIGQNSNYSNTAVYTTYCNNLTFENNTVEGSSWGLYYQYCANGTIKNNLFKNQATTGILNFGSAKTLIYNNTIINALNHGIDVRHSTGPNVSVLNNTIIASNEGIYLMHSKGHTAMGNKIYNCSLSSITCYGSSQITIVNNTLYKSRIGIFLGGSYSNISVGENNFKLDNLPFPPTFVYYVAEAKSDYQSEYTGTYSDSSICNDNYNATVNIATPKEISIDYTTILNPTGTTYTVTSGMNNDEIQTMINSMTDGDTLSFEENAIFNNISIYTDKNIKILGNNATLNGYNSINLSYVPEKIRNTTNQGGYGISERSILYIVNTTNAVVSNLNIISQYPSYDTSNVTTTTDEYKSVGLHIENSENITVTGMDISGASWGIFLRNSSDATVSNNSIHDIYTTGIMNFGSKNNIIINNTITNALNHGIDVRHSTGPNVTICFNTITYSKEGIYLMHSKGHTVYNNTIINPIISGVTAYGSGNEVIFNNTIKSTNYNGNKVRLAILLSGGYYNVTIGENIISTGGMIKSFPPTFADTIARAESKYQENTTVIRTYSDKETVTITVNNITVGYKKGELEAILTDQNGEVMSGKTITVTIANKNYTSTTDENGNATLPLNLTTGTYSAIISYNGNDNYDKANTTSAITVKDDRTSTALGYTSVKTVYLSDIVKGSNIEITLKTGNTPLSGKTVSINYNGKVYTGKTNSNGIATIKLVNTKTGSKKASIIFEGDDIYKSVSGTAIIKVTKESSKLKVAKKTFKAKKKTKKIKVVLKSKSGKAISKVKVTLKVNKKTFKAKTNKKGIAYIKIKLTKKGTYTAKTKFKGNAYYSAKSVNSKIKIK